MFLGCFQHDVDVKILESDTFGLLGLDFFLFDFCLLILLYFCKNASKKYLDAIFIALITDY